MKTLFILTLFAVSFAYGQTTKQINESMRTISENLFFDRDLSISLDPLNDSFDKIEPNTLISLKRPDNSNQSPRIDIRNYHVYVEVSNPLHYSVNVDHKLVVDQQNQLIQNFVTEIFQSLSENGSTESTNANVTSSDSVGKKKSCPCTCSCEDFISIYEKLYGIVALIKSNNGFVVWNGWTKNLIDLDFNSQKETKTQLDNFGKQLADADHFIAGLQEKLKSANLDITREFMHKMDSCSCIEQFEILNGVAERINTLINNQISILNNFRQVYQFVDSELKSWRTVQIGDRWFREVVSPGSVSKDSSAVVELKIKQHMVTIGSDGSITTAESSVFSSASILIIWHRHFIPEASTGVFYSYQQQSTYNRGSDGTVIKIGQRDFEQVTISTMLNFYLNQRNWSVLPYWQAGIGFQNKLPLLMIGVGSRFGLSERTVSLSGGLSFTAIEGLNQLNIGDAVGSEVDIKEDLRYSFSGPKFYFGIQYHF